MPLLSECGFTSFLQYSPRGTLESSKVSKQVTLCVKNNGTWRIGTDVKPVIPAIVSSLLRHRDDTPVIAECFRGEVIAVPVPGHAPKVAGALWVAEQICLALHASGLVSGVHPLLRRVQRVKKSAGSSDRPTTADHYETINVEPGVLIGRQARLLLVDDVVTRGATFLACTSRIREAYPANAVGAFAIIRTMSEIEVKDMTAPVTGKITMQRNGPHREP